MHALRRHGRAGKIEESTAESKRGALQNARADQPICDVGCITCGDQAVRARVVKLIGRGSALVDTGSTIEEISVELVDAAPGDFVLVHAKVAIAVLQEGIHDAKEGVGDPRPVD